MKVNILAILSSLLGAVLVLGGDTSNAFIGVTVASPMGLPTPPTGVTTTWTTLPTISSMATLTVTATTYVIVHVTSATTFRVGTTTAAISPTASKSLAVDVSNPFSQLTKGLRASQNLISSVTNRIESGIDFIAFMLEDLLEEVLDDLAVAHKDMFCLLEIARQLFILVYKHSPSWIYDTFQSLLTFKIIAPWTDNRSPPKPIRSHIVRFLDMLTVFAVCIGATIWVRKVELDALRRINGGDPLSRWIRPMIKPGAHLFIGINGAYCYILLQIIIAEGFGEPYSVNVRGVQRHD